MKTYLCKPDNLLPCGFSVKNEKHTEEPINKIIGDCKSFIDGGITLAVFCYHDEQREGLVNAIPYATLPLP